MATSGYYYQILKIDKDASIKEVKSAYRKLVHKYHPDVNKYDPLSSVKFKEVQNAYNELLKELSSKNYQAGYFSDKPYKSEKAKTKEHFSIFSKIFKPKSVKMDAKDIKKEASSVKPFFNFNKISAFLDFITTPRLIERLEHSDNYYVQLESLKAICERNSVKAVRIMIIYANSDDPSFRYVSFKHLKEHIKNFGISKLIKIWLDSKLNIKFKLLIIIEKFRLLDFIPYLLKERYTPNLVFRKRVNQVIKRLSIIF